MPTLQKILTLEVTPEQFLDNCSPLELMEVEILINSPRMQKKMHENNSQLKEINDGE